MAVAKKEQVQLRVDIRCVQDARRASSVSCIRRNTLMCGSRALTVPLAGADKAKPICGQMETELDASAVDRDGHNRPHELTA